MDFTVKVKKKNVGDVNESFQGEKKKAMLHAQDLHG